MATLKLNDVTTMTESGGTVTMADGVALGTPASGVVTNLSGTLPSGVTGGAFQAKIASGAITASAYIDIQGCFTSDYKFYKLLVGGYSVDGAYLEVGYLNSSNAHITDTYYSAYEQYYQENSSGGFNCWTTQPVANASQQNDTDGFRVNNTWQQRDETQGHMLEMLIYDPLSTSSHNHVHWFSTTIDVGFLIANQGWGTCNTSTAKHGIRLNASANTLDARGHFAVYGYRVSGEFMADYVIFNAEFPDGKKKSFTSEEKTAREKKEARTAEELKEFEKTNYARQRESAYPTVQELVVALYDTEDKAAIEAKRAEVKKKYPKP